MLEHFFTRRSVLDRLQTGLFGSYLEPLANQLQQIGYAPTTIRNYLYSCDRYGHWLAQQDYSVSDAGPEVAERYISTLKRSPASHLPRAAQGLNHLHKLLQQQGVTILST